MKAWVEGDFNEGDFRIVTPEGCSGRLYEIDLEEAEIIRILELQEEWARVQKDLRAAANRSAYVGRAMNR